MHEESVTGDRQRHERQQQRQIWISAEFAQWRVDDLVKQERVAVAERIGDIVEKRRRQKVTAPDHCLKDVLVDEYDKSRIPAISEQKIKSGNNLRAKKDHETECESANRNCKRRRARNPLWMLGRPMCEHVRFGHYYNTRRYHRLPGDLKAAIRSFMREIRWIKVVAGDGAAHPKNAKRQGGVERSDEVKIPN